MNKIESDGFISKEADAGRKHILTAYSDLFVLAQEINRFSMNFSATLVVDGENQHKLIVHTLLIRLLELFQGTYLMLERGMMVPAENLTRGMLEIVFTIVALEKRPELVQCYIDQHEKNHMQMLRAASEFKGEALIKNAREHNLQKLLEEKQNEMRDKKLETLKIKEWAKEAHLDDFYNVYYVIYSTSTHSSLASLDDHIDVETNGEINLAFGPSDKGLYEVFKCGISVLVNALYSVGKIFYQDLSSELDKLVARLKALDELYMPTA